jgi:hypothetical protein
VINIVDFSINCHSERSGTKKKTNFQELSLGLITVLANGGVNTGQLRYEAEG